MPGGSPSYPAEVPRGLSDGIGGSLLTSSPDRPNLPTKAGGVAPRLLAAPPPWELSYFQGQGGGGGILHRK